MKIPGFEYKRVPVQSCTFNVALGGSDGPPVMLLHGFPETHLAWRHVAPALARRHRVVCPDLKGYGQSDKPEGDREHQRYAKRTMAEEMVGLMGELGHRRFNLVGHDRGALVAFRLALDHPEVVQRLCVMDVLPAADMWKSLAGPSGVFAFHLYFLAQAPPLPERMISAAPDLFFGHFFDSWLAIPGAVPADVREHYLASARAATAVHAVCEDYRASAFVDPGHDDADRAAGRKLQMPVLAMWQDPGDRPLPFDPVKVWQGWAPRLRTASVKCGHFLPEEKPEEITRALDGFLESAS
jgi:haloacetate dehalogenase